MKLKRIIFSFTLIGSIVCVSPFQALAASSAEIQEQIESYLADLEASRQKSEELESEISSRQEEVGALFSEVAALNIEKDDYYQDMKLRIAYFYEEAQDFSLLSALFGASSFADFINRLQFQQSLYDYDSARLEEYQDLVNELEEKQDSLNAEIDSLGDLVEEQAVLQATLDAAITVKQAEYDEAVEAEEAARAAAEAAAREAAAREAERRASEEALAYAMSSAGSESTSSASEAVSSQETAAESSSGSGGSSDSYSESSSYEESYEDSSAYEEVYEEPSSQEETYEEPASSSPDSSGAVYESGYTSGGQLTRDKGVVYFNGHKETWYSTSQGSWGVVYGIPGRYTGSDGIIRDENGYICVASNDYPKGTVVETSLGTGKVYDTGALSGTVDIYAEW